MLNTTKTNLACRAPQLDLVTPGYPLTQERGTVWYFRKSMDLGVRGPSLVCDLLQATFLNYKMGARILISQAWDCFRIT